MFVPDAQTAARRLGMSGAGLCRALFVGAGVPQLVVIETGRRRSRPSQAGAAVLSFSSRWTRSIIKARSTTQIAAEP